MISRLRARRCSEDGSALILVLVFLTLFSILVVALLGLGSTSLAETNVVHDQRFAMASSEGAVDAAIWRAYSSFQSNYNSIKSGTPWTCPGLSMPNVNNVTATVDCSVRGTKITGPGGSVPANALMTIGGSISMNKKGTMSVVGDVYSGSRLDVRNRSALSVTGDAKAVRSPCPRVTATGTVTCGGVPKPTDPNYGPVLSSAPSTTATIPATCGSIVQFNPPASGLRFRSASSLNALTDGKGADGCAGKVLWFRPGVYYFNFNIGSGREWKINDKNMAIIGGAAQGGWDTDTSIRPPVPGACVNDGSGVQFVFGGDSRLNVSSGVMELCGRAGGAGGQRIAIYGPATTGSYTKQTSTIVKTGSKGTLVAHGTLYSPTGAVNLDAIRIFAPIFDRGIIARTFTMKIPKFSVTGIQLPSSSTEAEVSVDLTATVDGKDRVHALVTFDGAGGFTYTVQAWDVL